MPQRLAPEASEDRFRKFSAELLAVEEVGFSDGFFYSPHALRKILERFCNIIAENLHVQSCTVQLKLYDSFNSPLLKRLLESDGELLTSSDIEEPKDCSAETRLLWQNFSRKCIKRYYEVVGNNRQSKPEQVKFRQALMKNSMIFPYALYPKGALWLVASNKKGPWSECAPWLISQINRGIMTQIIQDKAARVRDRMSLRQTRSHRKLGPLDPYIWTNQPCAFDGQEQKSPLYFFNYYGVPIRIHQRGDVIGILRVENKGLGAKAPNTFTHEVLNRVLDMSLDGCEQIDRFATRLHTVFQAYKDEIADRNEFEPQEISLLSLAYLAHDLANAKRPSDRTMRDLCTLPYIRTNNSQMTATVFADSEVSERAPVQITFDNSEEERAFVEWLSAKRTTNIFRVVKIFFGKLNETLKATLTEKVVGKSIEQALVEAIREVRGSDSKLELTVERVELPLLHHLVKLDIPGEKRFRFYLQVTPTRAELKEKKFTEHWELTDEIAAQYRRVNSQDVTPTADDLEFHLPTDRLAARIEALTLAFPIPKFTVHDAWWLSWAALEIGKLIERQISYRGTNISPTVPLTAMDFFRVPISDLSFVDALRSQYKDAETVQEMLEYHIPNHCRELDLEVTLEHNCRVKNFRSYLERLGQEHRAHYDALSATWLYILHLRLADWDESRLMKALDDHKRDCKEQYLPSGLEDHFMNVNHCQTLYEQTAALLANLRRFYKELESVCEGKAVLFTDENCKWLRNSAHNAFADLKFAAPNVHLGEEKKKEKARKLVMTNLRASPQALAGMSSPPRPGEQMGENEISEYVFRRYDPFVTQCISLYILLTNIINEHGDENGYKSFYENSRQLTRFLREKFESSHQLNEQWRDVPKLLSATKRLIDELGQLRAKVSELSTTDFSAVMNTAVKKLPGAQEKEPSDAFLTVKGIYKRVRTLINISGDQLCPPLLNWETSRFDYVGARINCLFKNQVFAIYEHLWNRGDPFSHWTSGAPRDTDRNPLADTPKHPRPEGGPPRSEDEASRQRWLSIQTKIHKGEEGYNAWQISALLDPRAVLKGYYYSSASLYNINALRDYLVDAFDKWHKVAAKKYRDKAEKRSKLQEEYCRWFRCGYIRHVLRKDPVGMERELEQDVYFPEYLLRTPLDIFICLLETNLMSKRDLQEILGPLGKFIQGCSNKKKSKVLWKAAQKIYDKASALANGGYSKIDIPHNNDGQPSHLELVELDKALVSQLPALNEEKSRFEKLDKWPDLRAFKDKTLLARLAYMRRILEADAEVSEIWRKGLRHILIELQSSQKQTLFDIGDLRSSRNVLDRILCYVLLFRSEGRDDKFKDWSAHDLFYYVASLVPAEIQVRTALADTMAEQYHGVYKSNVDPAHSVAVQRRRLQEMGRKLDDLDRETEAIYDGYIVHSMLHAKS